MIKKLLLTIALFTCANNAFANQYEALGDAVQYALPLTALGMTFTEDDTEGRIQFAKGFGATFGMTYTVKLGVNRTRPNGADYSFPSGHTSASFSSAGYIHQRYGYKKGRVAYLAAAFVGWTRIQANKHYASDVLAGAALGSLTSYVFTSGKDMNLTTYKDRDTVGINVRFRW
ncbi:MAG: phosphatase PAP2 family protein [Gammaproteobacteria bacterium]|nr:phosphatase PAP2 family protein [Gammaproteobacteria bacterium]